MGKKQKYFDKIREYKDRFQDLTVEELRQKEINMAGHAIKEAAIAIRELIEEKQKNNLSAIK